MGARHYRRRQGVMRICKNSNLILLVIDKITAKSVQFFEKNINFLCIITEIPSHLLRHFRGCVYGCKILASDKCMQLS